MTPYPHAKKFRANLALALGLIIGVSSCSHYASVKEKPPVYESSTPAGQVITQAQKDPADQPTVQIGRYLDAAAAASAVLEKNPGDARARADYNFAVARIFEAVNEAGLEPWKAAVVCPGAGTKWVFSMKSDSRPERNLSNYKLVPADRYQFKGKLVVQDSTKKGIGAPLIAVAKGEIDATQIDRFAQGKHVYYGMTGLVDITGTNCVASVQDPLSVETVKMGRHSYPLAANFSAPIALALAELKPRKKELGGLFKPEKFATGPRLARLQPYDPKKIPLLCIHGLGDSHATWAPMIETLRADPVIRANYQIWFFSYASGNPYPYSASLLRKQMDEIKQRYPDHKDMVVIGHSMGGMISRTLMTDSGMTLWNATYDKPPSEMPMSEETRKIMKDALIFEHRRDIDRVIFASPSHRGAKLATGFAGRFGSFMIGGPKAILNGDLTALALAKPNAKGAEMKKMPNSVDFLNPENRFVKTLDTLPLAKGIPFHSILGDRGKGGNRDHTEPVSSDGIVPYWSSHLDGAESELVIPSGHWTNQHPQGIAEVKRILYLHLGKQ
jgi:pimeloyl-ACP methyl ester carboxylesterase